ncbi:12470_t:CDS:2 [Cetraspora pellucida]|uniref:12470_t:CDS:1 n=1 Tax=Cetraspora pellucida TaxID=1433469 RepID=A0ACA9KI12_9GLOM|nr:12470_t:CDS:2 [Cetraspora pellucida]
MAIQKMCRNIETSLLLNSLLGTTANEFNTKFELQQLREPKLCSKNIIQEVIHLSKVPSRLSIDFDICNS